MNCLVFSEKIIDFGYKFELNDNFKSRFEKFLSSDLFYNQPKYAKSPFGNIIQNKGKILNKKFFINIRGKIQGIIFRTKKTHIIFF